MPGQTLVGVVIPDQGRGKHFAWAVFFPPVLLKLTYNMVLL